MADSIRGSGSWLKLPGDGSRTFTPFYEVRALPRPGPFHTVTFIFLEGVPAYARITLVIQAKTLRAHVGGGVTQRN